MSRRSAHVRSRGALLAALLAILCTAAFASASPAFASAHWHVISNSAPTNLSPGGEGEVVVSATNRGDEDVLATSAAPIKVVDTVPSRLEIVSYRGSAGFGNARGKPNMTCSAAGHTVTCRATNTIAAYEGLEISIVVKVAAAEGEAISNEATVEGGGSTPPAPVSVTQPLKVSAAEVQFGVEKYELTPENEDGTVDSQAGSHPFQLTTTLDLNQGREQVPRGERPEAVAPSHGEALARNLHFVLPPGLLGNVTIMAQCSAADFSTIGQADTNACPDDTALGVGRITITEPNAFKGVLTETVPVFNLVPANGEPARFGLEIDKVPVILNTAVRTGQDYAVEVTVANASQAAGVLSTQVTFWGVPGDPIHDTSRGWGCLGDGHYGASFEPERHCELQKEAEPKPFLSLPTSCSASPVISSVTGETWPHGPNGEVSTVPAEDNTSTFPVLSGCNLLGFEPSIEVEPETHSASTPSGLAVTVALPQQSTLSRTGLAESDLKETVVALPEGVQASPGAANGLSACSASSFGFEGLATLGEPAQLENNDFTRDEVGCVDEAKIGTVSIKTPLLKNELHGSVYLAEQDTTLLEQRLVLYLTAYDAESGVRVKLAGDVHVDPNTGRLTSTFKNSPPVPFESLTLNFFGGPTASQSTPAFCGSYPTQAEFSPWSEQGLAARSASFSITSGVGGGPCSSNPQSFAPTFQAGVANNTAGAYSPFSLTIGHADADQPLSGLTMHLPPGAAAMLSSVEQCPEPPANQEWNCGASSLIGHSTSSSGLGGSPFTLGGSVYLTTGYGGAPFGLLVVTPAEAGPFHLGNVNVRSKIFVDKTTAAVTIVSDPFPTFVRGVPVQLKQINVTVDRPNFEFNPTNCTPMSVSGTLTGVQGGSEGVSSPFTVTNCAALPFKPKLSASTQGNATKANGASLTVRVESSPGQANIAKTKLVLPITLPSRLTTIQKACLDSVFEANPAACDEGSNIGTAIVHTPVLKNPLIGPAYLVSHGGAAFPDIEFVLQGEGITLILDGQTDIKKGITTSTFNTVPDAPVTVFETKLPEGPHSALTSNVAESKKFNLCGAKLTIPTTITGQNGVVVQQETKVPVEGCAVVKGFKVTRAQQLSKALKACRKEFKHSKKKRAACEKKAQKKYGAKKKAKKKSAKKSKKK